MSNDRKTHSLTICLLLLSLVLLLSGCSGKAQEQTADTPASATTAEPEFVGQQVVPGKVYTFDKDNTYQFSSATSYTASEDADTYGHFSISGTSAEIESADKKDGVPAYSVGEGHVAIQYTYSDKMLGATNEEWHLDDDGNSTIDVFKIDNNIQKGAVILQKSMDHLNWYNVSVQTNAFVNTPVQNGTLYETTDIEMINGCYYRLIVVYKTAIKTGQSTTLLVIPKDEMEYKRTAEVYEFYVVNKNEHIEELAPNSKRYSLGETTLVSDFASYSGSKAIEKGDLHYGWNLGNFFVSGFTSTADNKGDVVFLKNVGDVVTLWFNLEQNINALNNDSSLVISSDNDGHDQYFQTPATNFGRGMLIIRYTDYENIKHEPVMYYDYLLANTLMGTNTRVQLFEEGDYEVALDYEVKKNQLIPQTHHYRIFFKFSVRNANCMVYPFDVETGAELTNSAVTSSGFYLDLAKSRYLKIYIKKEVWTEGADGLTEDTRFNTTAKDGDRYTDEGIYTITVKNQYTGQETVKKIYVGTNRILLAYMNSDYSIAQIQRLVEEGATIYEDGTIELPTNVPATEAPTETPEATDVPESSVEPTPTAEPWIDEALTREPSNTGGLSTGMIVFIVCAVVLVCVSIFVAYRKKSRGKEEKQ